ncbi:MAG TPA: 50S ribosomal protein L11 methyltransferase [Pyrinomonadaceae bacterium]|jgi:SAM-dependent methyltransferase
MTGSDDSYYAHLPVHAAMLSDRARCDAYRRALAKWVNAGDVVLDVGAGTGILSLFAVRSGARKVYAVERTSIGNLARQLIETNGLAEQVQVIQGNMETIELPEQVDLIVSEWMGGYGVDEGFLPAVLIARDRWLKPVGKMLPERVTSWVAPVSDSELESDSGFWHSRPYGVDFSLIAEMIANEVRYCQHHITGDTLLAEPQPMWMTDVYTCSVEEARSVFKVSLSFPITRAGNFNALATWFHAEFGRGVALTNAPDAPKTHWGRFIYPLDDAMKVERGTEVSVKFACEPTVNSHCRSKWSVKVGDGAWEHHQSIN